MSRCVAVSCAALTLLVVASPVYAGCKKCEAARIEDGWCGDCKVGYFDGVVIKSKELLDALARKEVNVGEIKCTMCKTAAAEHGWCDACKVGLVGNRAFNDKQDYANAVRARKILLMAAKAAEKRPSCAVAMVTDGECATCKVSFKNGMKVVSEAKGPGK